MEIGDIIKMSKRELKRLKVIHQVLEDKLKQVLAAEILHLTDRQIRRIVKKVREEGDEGIIHKNRDKPSSRALPKKIKSKVIKLYREKYEDFGPTLANEKLFERDNIKIGDQTLRNWLLEDGAWQITQKHRKHLQWRERKHIFGEMIQMDGSRHAWFEGRGPECVLMGYIDDATNKVFARFYEYEGTFPAMGSFKGYIKKHGLPNSIYLDKHSTYKSTAKKSIEDELNNRDPMSHFQRALKELGVEIIYAGSAPAKGRVERLFGTFQDRVIKEMRLEGIKDIDSGNKFLDNYLPIYNKRFSKEPIEKGNLHRPIPKGMDLDTILCIRTDRSLRNDFTVAHDKKLYQVLDHINAKKVMVEERIDGRMFMKYKGKRLRFKEIIERPVRPKAVEKPRAPRKSYRPPSDHPWRKFKIKPYMPVNRNKEVAKEPVLVS